MTNEFGIFSINQQKVLSLLEGKEFATTGEISKSLGIPRPTAKQILQRLLGLHLISRQGLGRGAYYCLKQKDEIYDSKGNKLVTVYKGLNSFKIMFKELQSSLKKGDFYWSFAFKNEYHDPELSQFLLDFHRTKFTTRSLRIIMPVGTSFSVKRILSAGTLL